MLALASAAALFPALAHASTGVTGQLDGFRFPRAELHVHLDGAVPVETLYAVCLQRQIELQPGAGVPASPESVAGHLASQQTWVRFDTVNDIIGGDARVIQKVAEDFVKFQARSGVMYTEVRYDPVRLARSKFAAEQMSLDEVVMAVQRGLAAGAARHSVVVYQILCAMRGKSPDQCFEVANLTNRTRTHAMGGVVAMDLAGDEVANPNGPYVDCFRHAKRTLGLNITVHAGEFNLSHAMAGDVATAISEMGADRIGHGYATAADAATLAVAKARRIHFELCPASALAHQLLGTLGVLRGLGVSFSLNTDDPASWIGNTTAAADEDLVRTQLGFSTQDIDDARHAALSAAFAPAAKRWISDFDHCTVCERVAGTLASGGFSCGGTCTTLAIDPQEAAACGALCAAVEAGACHAKGPGECATTLCEMVHFCGAGDVLIV